VRVGIFDHLSLRLGGSQLVVAWIASILSRQAEVELIHCGRAYRVATLAKAFGVELSRVRERVLDGVPQTFARSLRADVLEERRFDRTLTEGYDLFIYSGHGVPPYSWAARAMAYCHFPFEASPALSAQSDPRWSHRIPPDRWVRIHLYRHRWRRRLSGYSDVIGNSQFTAGWIERLWGVRAQVVYPPVTAAAPSGLREKAIVSLGRFVRSDRKSAAAQIEAFARVRGSLGEGWRLIMMGFCADLPDDQESLERLRKLASGLPVVFLVNAPRQEIMTHLATAKLFWHTAGLGDLGSTEPRYREHFGIATVEAMQLGCVPIVPAGGGQSEIVEHGISGFVCGGFEALERHTVELAADGARWDAMSQAAVKRGGAFGPDVFERRLATLLAGKEAQVTPGSRR
jgi:glycosyltransferase involved in cell wall biosynthesis